MARTNINLLTLTGDLRQDDVQELRAQGGRPGDQEHPRQLHLLREQQGSRTAATPARRGRRKPRGTRPARPSTTRARATSSPARGCSPRPRYAHVDGGFQLAPVGGLRHGLLHRRRRRRAQHVLPVSEHPAAGLHRRRRQLLRRQARGEVRRRVALDAGDHRSDLAGEPPDRQLGRLPEHVRPGRARLPGVDRREVPQRLRHRHDLAEPV